MSALVTSLIVDAAAKLGAPIIRDVLSQKFGKTGSVVADAVIGVIADKAGVEPAALPSCPPDKLDCAIIEAELDIPAIIAASVDQQSEANRLMLAEMDKGSMWTWAWRPAFMWAILAFWAWALVLIPFLNAATGLTISLPYMDQLLTISLAYIGLYMGGHTAKEFAKGRNNARLD